MARKQVTDRTGAKEKVEAILTVPLTPRMRETVVEMARCEERTPGGMGRILIREAIEARKAGK